MEFTKLFVLLTVVSSLVFAKGAPYPSEIITTPPHYEFHYAVHDSHTGDIKDQFEHRRGDYVTGRYSLIEPDGRRRVVEYSSDPIIGFTAEVHREIH